MSNNSEKIFLVSDCNDNVSSNIIQYNLMTYDCHNDNFEDFYPFALDVIEQIFVGYTPLITHQYDVKKHSRSSWFSPNKPAIFYENSKATELIKYINSSLSNWTYYEIEHSEKLKSLSNDWKIMFVSTSKVDRSFIERNYNPCIGIGIYIYGYSPIFFKKTNNVQKLAEDFIDKECTNNYAIYASFEESHTVIRLSINSTQFPADELIRRINTVAIKHGKILDINL